MKSAMRTKSAHGLCLWNCNGSFVVLFFWGGGGVVYFLRWDRVENIVANKVLLIVTAADCCHGFWFWCFLLLVIAKFLLFFSVFDIFSLAIFEGGIDVVWLSTLLWVSLSMMLKNALFFSNLEDQHWKKKIHVHNKVEYLVCITCTNGWKQRGKY